MQDWQPIETAPKDGSTFLGYVAHWATPGMFYWESHDEDAPQGFWDTAYRTCRASMFAQPTHWMPLPDPPAAIAERIGTEMR